MKSLVTLLVLLLSFVFAFAQSSAQPIKVLLIGTSHSYGKQPTEKFDYVKNKVRAFKPDAMFGEWLSAADYDAIPDYWNKATMVKRYAYIQSLGYPAPKNHAKFLRQSYSALRENPNFHQVRMRLANALLQHHDYGNAQFQIYQLMQRKAAFGAEEMATFTKTLGPVESVQSIFYRTTSEYYHLVFPLMNELHLNQMMAMDCQKYDALYSDAHQKAGAAFQAFEEQLDTTSAGYARLMAMYTRLLALQKLRDMAAKTPNSLRFSNSAENDTLAYMDDNFGGSSIYDIKGYPKAEVLTKEKYWLLRNECMTRNIVTRARAAGAKRVVVAVGANHREPMLKMLRATPGVTVYTLNEYQPQK